jgi:hypothetical protein
MKKWKDDFFSNMTDEKVVLILAGVVWRVPVTVFKADEPKVRYQCLRNVAWWVRQHFTFGSWSSTPIVCQMKKWKDDFFSMMSENTVILILAGVVWRVPATVFKADEAY